MFTDTEARAKARVLILDASWQRERADFLTAEARALARKDDASADDLRQAAEWLDEVSMRKGLASSREVEARGLLRKVGAA